MVEFSYLDGELKKWEGSYVKWMGRYVTGINFVGPGFIILIARPDHYLTSSRYNAKAREISKFFKIQPAILQMVPSLYEETLKRHPVIRIEIHGSAGKLKGELPAG